MGDNEKGCFSVKSSYECLAKNGIGPRLEVFKFLWKTKAFPNVTTTTLRAMLGILPTRECLSRRGVALESTLCALCQAKVKSCQHLFLECSVALCVWALCYRWIGILFVQHNDLKNHFKSFLLIQASNKQNMVWKGVWVAIVRCIWEHRNSVVFKLWLWMKHKVHTFNYSFVDWILNPMSCIKSYK